MLMPFALSALIAWVRALTDLIGVLFSDVVWLILLSPVGASG
jgi:hypothetical protein